MGGGASKKKPQGQEEKKPVWVDNLGLEDGTSYTGLSAMGLVRLKPDLVGQQNARRVTSRNLVRDVKLVRDQAGAAAREPVHG